MSFTPRQQAHYRPLVDRAWMVECQNTGAAPNSKAAKNDWYRNQLVQAIGVYTTKQCNCAEDFDRVMLHFAIIANDEYWITRTTSSGERRMMYQIKRYMRDLAWLEKEKITWEYIRGIYKQSGQLPSRLSNCPAATLRKLLAMLDTHIRRICKDYGIRPCELPTRSHPHKEPVPIRPEAKHLHVGHDLDKEHCHHTTNTELPF